MSEETFAQTADRLRRCEEIPGAVEIKRNPVRTAARVRNALLKSWARPCTAPQREARALERADALGLSVPKLLGAGRDWIATRWIDGRPATREDLPEILALVTRMHDAGMLHGDLHLGNLLVFEGRVWLTDLQSARFLPRVPGFLRRRELGFLAYSLGDPLPPELRHVWLWRELRAQRHWRSRTRRCLIESSGFTRFELDGASGFRRREVDPDALAQALRSLATTECIKRVPSGALYRVADWIVKDHPTQRVARRAWINGHGLEMRGVRTGLPLAWLGTRLVMRDAGGTLIDWVETEFEKAGQEARAEMADRLADLLAILHRRGIYHADLKANNIVWRPGTEPALLDYARVAFGWRVGRRRRIKNLSQLNAALPDVVPADLRERALRRYVEQSGLSGEVDRLRRPVVELSLRRRHRWSGC